MIASLPFLIATFFIYGCFKDLRNLHGKCLMGYVFSLTLMYVSIATIELEGVDLVDNHRNLCYFFGYMMLMSILMSFLWLNVMCYDIWTTFRKGRKIENRKRFICYCLYAFGIPLVIISIAFILNKQRWIPDSYNTQIGEEFCKIPPHDTEQSAYLNTIYVYSPMMFCLLVNICFYSITAYMIFRVQRETTSICRRDGNHCSQKRDFDKER
jgi:hypothetical protein